MFDQEIQTLIREDGTVEQRSWLAEDALQAEAMEQACDALVKAERRFKKVNAQPEAVTDPKLNALWWERMEEAYLCDRALWELFTGKDRSVRSNKLYNQFRRMLLEGSSLKANA